MRRDRKGQPCALGGRAPAHLKYNVGRREQQNRNDDPQNGAAGLVPSPCRPPHSSPWPKCDAVEANDSGIGGRGQGVSPRLSPVLEDRHDVVRTHRGRSLYRSIRRGERAPSARDSGADRLHPGFKPRLRGWLGRQCRASRHWPELERRCRRSPVGDQFLSPAAQRAAAPWRRGGRSFRSAPHADFRGHSVWRKFCVVCGSAEPGLAPRGARPSGDRCGTSPAEQPCDPRKQFFGRSARPGGRHVVGGRCHRRRYRARVGRLGDRRLRMAWDIFAQHPACDRRGRFGTRLYPRSHPQ